MTLDFIILFKYFCFVLYGNIFYSNINSLWDWIKDVLGVGKKQAQSSTRIRVTLVFKGSEKYS